MTTEQERADFEWWASDEGENPRAVERVGECYKLAQIQSYWMAWQARAALQSQGRGDALTKLVAACPTDLQCDDFHHKKADQHMSNEACPPLARYLAAIDHARRIEGVGND